MLRLRIFIFGLLTYLSIAGSSSCFGDLLLTIGNGSSGTPILVTPGVETLVPVFLSRATNPTGSPPLNDISGVSFGIDFGAIGNVGNGTILTAPFPSILDNSATTAAVTSNISPGLTLIFGDASIASVPANMDRVLIGNFSAPQNYSFGSLVKIFDIRFTPTFAAEGVYAIRGVPDADVTYYTQNGNDITNLSFSNGSIQVVPEPTSMTLIAVFALAALGANRVRRLRWNKATQGNKATAT